MESLQDLLFELSNDDRLLILLELEKAPLNLSRIANTLHFTAQGTSRNVARLVQASLIIRNSDGEYALTPYCHMLLKLLDSFRFLSKNKQYFLSHDPSVLPYNFSNRLGELEGSTFQGDVITAFAIAEKMLASAEKYSYNMTEQLNYHVKQIVTERLKQGVVFRTILPETIVPPPGFQPPEGVERRLLSQVKLNIYLTDKGAMMGFPTLEGKIDYGVFVSDEPKFRKWCLDLFNYFWEIGRPIRGPLPNLS